MPGVRVVATPAPQVLGLSAEKVKEQAEVIVPEIIKVLTRPAAESKATSEKASVKRFVFDGTIEEINQHFLGQRWTDGLPVMPPTEEAVKRMLAGTDRDPDEVVGTVSPRNGRATIEVIAANAVMAGCRPEYMPVLIAAVEAVTEPEFNLSGVQSTSNSVSPLLIVNGPIRRQLNINSEMGLIGYGFQANNTIARALRLIMIAAGGSWPDDNAMCTLGKLPIFLFGEWEEASPWPPLHVELGHRAEESTVTAVHASAFHAIAAGTYPAERLIENIGQVMGEPGPLSREYWWGADLTLVLNPLHAEIMAAAGLSKEEVKKRLMERAKVPFSRLKSSHFTPGKIGDACPWINEVKDDTMIPLVDQPDQLTLVVASGRNWGHAAFFPAWGCYRSRVTKKIK